MGNPYYSRPKFHGIYWVGLLLFIIGFAWPPLMGIAFIVIIIGLCLNPKNEKK